MEREQCCFPVSCHDVLSSYRRKNTHLLGSSGGEVNGPSKSISWPHRHGFSNLFGLGEGLSSPQTPKGKKERNERVFRKTSTGLGVEYCCQHSLTGRTSVKKQRGWAFQLGLHTPEEDIERKEKEML